MTALSTFVAGPVCAASQSAIVNVPVQSRDRPAYDARGVRAGVARAFPNLNLAIETTDNLFASSTDQRGDVIVRLRPQIVFKIEQPGRSLTAQARALIDRHATYEAEDVEAFDVGADGRLEIIRGHTLTFGSEFGRAFEARSDARSDPSFARPTQVDIDQTYLGGARDVGRISLSARAEWRVLDYQDNRDRAGAAIDQDFRDRDILQVSGRVTARIGPDAFLFLQAAGDQRRHHVEPGPLGQDRNSNSARYLVGARFGANAPVRGEVAVGYIEQDFRSEAVDDVSGLGVRADMQWLVSGLTTLSLTADRSVDDAAEPGAGAFVSSSASLGVDHELLRNIILDGRLTVGRDTYAGTDRRDTRLAGRIGATFLMNRSLGWTLSYAHENIRSTGRARDRDFTTNAVSLTLVLQV